MVGATLTAIERAEAARRGAPAPRRIDETAEMNRIAGDLKESADTTTARLAEIAAKKVAQERAKAGGLPSGKTMLIMASTMKQVQHSTKAKTAKRWVKVVALVACVAAVTVAVMGIVIAQQKRQIEQLVKQKEHLDKEIETVGAQMNEESDHARVQRARVARGDGVRRLGGDAVRPQGEESGRSGGHHDGKNLGLDEPD